jgi:hypothetical protein
MCSRWRGQLGTAHEGAPLRRRAPHPAGGVRQPTAALACLPEPRVRRMAFAVVPALRRRLERRRIRRALLERQPRMGVAHRCHRRPAVNRAAVPQPDEGAPQRPQARTKAVGHSARLDVPGLAAAVPPQMLALGRPREDGHARAAVRLSVVADDGRVPPGRPGAAAGRDPQQAALIPHGEGGPTSSGVFVWPAPCRAARGPWPARRVGWPGLRGADHSSRRDARASSRVPGERAPPSAPGSPPRGAVRSTARWQPPGTWLPGASAGPVGDPAGRSTGAAGQGGAWGPRPPRPPGARRGAPDARRPRLPGRGVPPRAGCTPGPGARWPGVGAVLPCWAIQRGSGGRDEPRALIYAIINMRVYRKPHMVKSSFSGKQLY